MSPPPGSRPVPPTLSEALARAAGSDRGIRFVAPDESADFRSYARLHEDAARMAGGLRSLGLRPGDRVALVLPTSPAFLASFFGASLAGLVPVPLYPPLRLGRLAEYRADTAALLARAGARLVLTERRLLALLAPCIRRARTELGGRTVDEVPRGPPVAAEGDPEATAFLQFTSGTTGDPKPIALSHRAVLANAAAIRDAILAAWPEGPDLRHAAVSWLPLYHDMGLVGCVLTSLLHPADLALLPPEGFVARPSAWLRAISRWRATVSAAPNFAYSLCADRVRDEDLAGVDLSGWRAALCGAEPVAPAVLRRFAERFAPFGLARTALTPVYGLGEAALAVTFSDPAAPFSSARFDRRSLVEDATARPAADGVELASAGRPLPGFEVRIADEAGRETEAGRVGRVLVRGPSLMQGYFGCPAETAAALRGGWLDTGDLGFRHAGELFLYGRRSERIALRGRKYAPQLIEACLDGLEGARKGCAAAIGVQEAEGETLVVLLERARRRRVRGPALADAAARRIASHTGLVPARVVVLPPGTLPRTSSGKIRRAEARRRWLAGTLRPPAGPGWLTRLRLAASALGRRARERHA